MTLPSYLVRLFVTAVLPLVLTVGCDDMPQQAVPPTIIKPSVTSSGRGTYDWTFSKDVFDVEMPTKFLFPSKIDKSKILAELSVARPSFLGDEFPRPEGMNDDTFRAIGRYMNVPKPVERKEISTVGPGVPIGALALNRDGKLAAVYTSKLLIIDSSTGATIRELPTTVEGVSMLSFTADSKQLTIVGANSVCRMDIASAAETSKWETKQDPIVSVAFARDSDSVAIATSMGTVYALAQDLSLIRQRMFVSLYPNSLAISPDGQQVITASANGVSRWYPHTENDAIFRKALGQIKFDLMRGICGTYFDRWVAGKIFFEQDRSLPFETRANTPQLTFIPEFLHASTLDGSQDWMTCIGSRRDAQGDSHYFIQDFMNQFYATSTAQELPVKKIYKAAFNQSSNRVLASTDLGLVVFDRLERVDTRGEILRVFAGYLVSKMEFQQLELLGGVLRTCGVVREANSAIELFDQIALDIGEQWEIDSKDSNLRPRLDAFNAWYSKGSEFAILCSACRYSIAATTIRLKYRRSYFPEDQLRLKRKYESKQKQEVDKLFEKYQPSPGGYALNIELLEAELIDRSQVDLVFQEALEKWPDKMLPAIAFATALLPRSVGEMGETGALLNAISRLLPKPQSEIAYAKIVAGLLYFEFSEVLNEGKISKGKFKIAFEESIKARKLQSFEAERFFTTLSNLESNVDDSYRAKLLAEYYNSEFGMQSILLYRIEPGPRATIPRLLDKYMK